MMPSDRNRNLAHYGVKGMHWGVRRDNPSGGTTHPPSEDFTRVTATRQKIKEGGTKSLSNKELQDVITRMNLEQQYAGLKAKEPTRFSRGFNAVKQIISVARTIQDVYNIVNSPAMRDIGKGLKRK